MKLGPACGFEIGTSWCGATAVDIAEDDCGLEATRGNEPEDDLRDLEYVV